MIANVFKYAPVQVFASLCLFVLIGVQTHFLSIESYGVLAIVIVFLEAVRAIFSQWLVAALLRFYPSANIQDKIKLVSTTCFVSLSLVIPALVAIFLGLYFYELLSLDLLISSSMLFLMKIAYMYKVELCRLEENTNKYRKAVLINSIMSIVISWILLYAWSSITSAILALALSNFVALLFLNNSIKFKFDREMFGNIISYGFPIMFSGGMIAIGSRLDRLFIAKSIGLEETGIYSAFSNILMGVISLVFMTISLPLYPELAKSANDKYQLLEKHQNYLDMLFAITLPSLVGICVISEPLIKIFLDQQYLSQGVELFWILAVSVYLFNFKIHYIDHGLHFINKTKHLPFVAFLSMLINFLLLYFTLTYIGVYAAAWATLIANLIGIVLTMLIALYFGYRYKVGINFIKVFFSCGLMLIALALKEESYPNLDSWIDMLTSIFIGILVYSVSMVSFNFMKIKDVLFKLVGMR